MELAYLGGSKGTFIIYKVFRVGSRFIRRFLKNIKPAGIFF